MQDGDILQSIYHATKELDIQSFNSIIAHLDSKGIARHTTIPFASSTVDKSTVTVYPNFMLNVSRRSSLKDFSDIHGYHNRVLPIITRYKEEILIPKAKIKWERAKSTLHIKHNTTLTKYLKSIVSVPLSDHILRDLTYTLQNKNTKYKIVQCETPKDYIKQHTSVSTSCMAISSTYYGGNSLRTRIYKDLSLWASMFYAYCPQVKGIYIEDENKKVVARAFIFDIEGKGKFTKYGGLNGDNAHKAIMAEYLKVKGFSPCSLLRECKIIVPFSIPSVHYEGKILCPIPTPDNIAKQFAVTYNKNMDTFDFTSYEVGGEHLITDMYPYNNWMDDKYTKKLA